MDRPTGIYIGTCGWSYPRGEGSWKGHFYPAKVNELQYYSSIFSTVEVNSSFYHPPLPATVYSWLAIGLTQGFLVGLAFWVLGLPAPVLWGGITAFFCFIPFAGAPVVWLPASLILIFKGMYLKGLVLGFWGALVVSLVDNFLRPIIVGGSMRIHIMLVFFAIFGGLMLMGPLGLIMGPVILAMTVSLLDVLRHKMELKEPGVKQVSQKPRNYS